MTSSHVLEWSNELALRLIDEFEGKPELWDVQNDKYRIQSAKYAAWAALAATFDCHPMDVKRKMNSLLTSHRRERARVACGARSRWFAYDALRFISDKFPECDGTGGGGAPDIEDDKEEATPTAARVVQERRRPLRSRRRHERRPQPVAAEPRRTRDACDVFGEYVAQSLRQYDPRSMAVVKHAINNILFETEMKKYSPLNLLDLVDGDTLEGEEMVVELQEEVDDEEEEADATQDVDEVDNQPEVYNFPHLKTVALHKPMRLLNRDMNS